MSEYEYLDKTSRNLDCQLAQAKADLDEARADRDSAYAFLHQAVLEKEQEHNRAETLLIALREVQNLLHSDEADYDPKVVIESSLSVLKRAIADATKA